MSTRDGIYTLAGYAVVFAIILLGVPALFGLAWSISRGELAGALAAGAVLAAVGLALRWAKDRVW